MKSEGVAIPVTIAGGLILLLQVLRSFGMDITDAQTKAISDLLYSPLIELVIITVAGYVARRNVYSRESVQKLTGRVDPPVPAGPAVLP